MFNDLEEDGVEVNYVHGYPSLAAIIASDSGAAIYRRFDRLSARTLLYMQSELSELESELETLERADLHNLENGANEPHRDWNLFKAKAEDPDNEKWRQRMTLVKEIQEKLKIYQEALVLNSTLLSAKQPSKQAHKALYNTFHNEDKKHIPGGAFPTLEGRSANIYDRRADLLALRAPAEEDRLSKLLRTHFSILFAYRRPAVSGYLTYISEARIRIVVGIINVILAAALLFGAIYNLYYVQDERKRLGLITGYTTVFALCIGLLTNARRSEIFGACAAYAAVLVVFVSGSITTGKSGTCTPCPSPGGVG